MDRRYTPEACECGDAFCAGCEDSEGSLSVSRPRKISTHTHTFGPHPNPEWSTHLACTICGFAMHRQYTEQIKRAGGVILPGGAA